MTRQPTTSPLVYTHTHTHEHVSLSLVMGDAVCTSKTDTSQRGVEAAAADDEEAGGRILVEEICTNNWHE